MLLLQSNEEKRADKKKSLGDYDRQNTVTKSLQAYFLK